MSDDEMAAHDDVTSMRCHDDVTSIRFHSKVEEIILNADPGFGDIYLVSRDRHYFLAHRIVLASASSIFATLLTANCSFCSEIIDDKVVLIFAEVSGDTLKSFLSLIYTGLSDNLGTIYKRRELLDLCIQVGLKSINPAPTSHTARCSVGYKIVEAPECYSTLKNFMHSPVQIDHVNEFLDYSMSEFSNMITTKTEPIDYVENDDYVENNDYLGNEDYYEESAIVVDLPVKSSGKAQTKKRLKRDENLEGDEKVDPDYTKPKVKRSHFRLPEVNIPFREENGQLYCLSANCKATFSWMNGLKEHYFDKHATDEEKKFPCDFCGVMFGTNGLRNRHQKKCCPENETFSSNSPLKKHLKKLQQSALSDLFQVVVKKELEDQDLNISRAEEDGNDSIVKDCSGGTSVEESHSFQSETGVNSLVEQSTNDFPCKRCGKFFESRRLQIIHYRTKHSIVKGVPLPLTKSHTCKVCSEKFQYLRLLRKHHREVHKDVEMGKELSKPRVVISGPKVDIPMREEGGRFHCLSGDCEIKKTSFLYIGGLREHYFDKHAREDEKYFPCNHCGENFGTNGLRNRHHKCVHPDKPLEFEVAFPFAKPVHDCTICKQDLGSREKLEEHVRLYHGDQERPFICHTCGKGFKQNNSLRDHMQLHSNTLITCEVCGQNFKGEHFFKRHYTIKHATDFGCTLCDKRFGMKSQLTGHMRYHTGEKPYVCETCGKGYEMRSALTVHIKRVHSEEERVRKYACDMCDKLFFEPDKVRKHKRFFHLKLRNYKCNLCGETFRQKTTLDNHLDKHAGISFPCPHCTEKFACKSYVRKHLRKRHRELLAPKK